MPQEQIRALIRAVLRGPGRAPPPPVIRYFQNWKLFLTNTEHPNDDCL